MQDSGSLPKISVISKLAQVIEFLSLSNFCHYLEYFFLIYKFYYHPLWYLHFIFQLKFDLLFLVFLLFIHIHICSTLNLYLRNYCHWFLVSFALMLWINGLMLLMNFLRIFIHNKSFSNFMKDNDMLPWDFVMECARNCWKFKSTADMPLFRILPEFWIYSERAIISHTNGFYYVKFSNKIQKCNSVMTSLSLYFNLFLFLDWIVQWICIKYMFFAN